MTPETNVQIVSRLFLATGRKPEPATFAVWEEALDDLQDGPALEAAMQVVRTIDMTYGPPSPVFVRDAYQAIMRRRPAEQPALVEETNPVVATADVAYAALEGAIAQLLHKQRLPEGGPTAVRPEPERARPGHNAHAFGDHALCGSDCALKVPELTSE